MGVGGMELSLSCFFDSVVHVSGFLGYLAAGLQVSCS